MYPLTSALVSGAVFFALGRYSHQFSLTDHQQSASVNSDSQNRTDSFSPEAIKPIVRVYKLNPHCIVHYSTLHKVPLAVHESLDKVMIEGTAKRSTFFADPTLSGNSQDHKFVVDDSYYKGTQAYRNFDVNRGHMAAAGNYNGNQQLKNSTFSFANILPQNTNNNGGIWNTFERYCRSLLKRDLCDTLQIISGPIYHANSPHPDGYPDVYENREVVLKKNGIIVPPKLYKIIKCNKGETAYASGFVFENRNTQDADHGNSRALISFEESLQELESGTGLTFTFKDRVQPLKEVDLLGLTQTKKHYDQSFYESLAQQARTLSDLNQAVIRGRQQGIRIDLQPYLDKAVRLGQQELERLRDKSQSTVCQRLNSLLGLYRELYYLNSLPAVEEQLAREIYEHVIPCREGEEERPINDIKHKLGLKKPRFEYPHKHFMNRVFSVSGRKAQEQADT